MEYKYRLVLSYSLDDVIRKEQPIASNDEQEKTKNIIPNNPGFNKLKDIINSMADTYAFLMKKYDSEKNNFWLNPCAEYGSFTYELEANNIRLMKKIGVDLVTLMGRKPHVYMPLREEVHSVAYRVLKTYELLEKGNGKKPAKPKKHLQYHNREIRLPAPLTHPQPVATH